jgi:hypothetical protein
MSPMIYGLEPSSPGWLKWLRDGGTFARELDVSDLDREGVGLTLDSGEHGSQPCLQIVMKNPGCPLRARVLP